MAYRKVIIDEKQVEKLAAKFWEVTEIAAFFDCDPKTVSHRFAVALAKGRQTGKGYLRDMQLAAAKKGSAAMLIWLGKQYLNQSEKIEVVNTELIKEEIEIFGNGHKKPDYLDRLAKFINN